MSTDKQQHGSDRSANSVEVALLISREKSSMASLWEEHLGVQQLGEGRWRVGTFRHNWLSLDAIPRTESDDEDDEEDEEEEEEEPELVIPDEIDGRRILRLVDGEFLETDELISFDQVEFCGDELERAYEFCGSRGWVDESGFATAWIHIESAVNPVKSLSAYSAFKEMPLLRLDAENDSGLAPAAELGIYRSNSETELWVWVAGRPAECFYSVSGSQEFTHLVRKVAENSTVSVDVAWQRLTVFSIGQLEGIVFASAWAKDVISKTAAKLVATVSDSILSQFFTNASFDGLELRAMAERLCEYAKENGVRLDELGAIKPRSLRSLGSLERNLKRAVDRVALKHQQESERLARIAPFRQHITRLVELFCQDKPTRYYYRAPIPPLGARSLQSFLEDYVSEHERLPAGNVHVPYSNIEIGTRSESSFAVDMDELTSRA